MNGSGQLSFFTVLIRMSLAVLAGGVIGYGRSKRNCTAGFRTYMLTAVGASLSILLSIYEYQMMQGQWAEIVAEAGMKFDASRFGSQVISGGFSAMPPVPVSMHVSLQP
ncbi:MAG: MgtC/SapB family protein [Solobacterium sp.]|nr:MgtC/SapB family protein [Solobacterium sp.]